MFKYLKREIDIIKWIYVLENKYDELYYCPILINNDDIKILAKIIYYLLNIKEQNLNDKYYKKLINCSFNNQNIILENNKINLKIREKFNFIKCNINLGILAKHIIFQNNYIEFNDDNDEINVLKNELNIIKNKYLKYKKKYYNIKINIK